MSDRQKVSDEIREWCRCKCGLESGDFVTSASFDELRSLTDRIDAEMVELPRSADGKIWTGRETCFWTSAEQEGRNRFGCIALSNGNWYVESTGILTYRAESVWHERPDSFELIADELDEMVDAASHADDTCERLADLADRIRRLAKEGEAISDLGYEPVEED